MYIVYVKCFIVMDDVFQCMYEDGTSKLRFTNNVVNLKAILTNFAEAVNAYILKNDLKVNFSKDVRSSVAFLC